MKTLEEMIAEIRDIVLLGKTPAPPGAAEYKRAVEAMADGDIAPLTLYLRRGGVIPKAETIWPTAAVQRGGSNAPRRYRPRAGGRDAGRRSESLPTVATTPVMPPETKGQRQGSSIVVGAGFEMAAPQPKGGES